MSYILDALRRADAERGRGSVPSIHTQQQFAPLEGDDDGERTAPRRAWWIVGGVAVLLVAAAVAWIALRPEPAAVVAAAPRAVVPVSPVPGPLPTPDATPRPATPPAPAASPGQGTARDEAPRSEASRTDASRTAERHARARASKLPDIDTEPPLPPTPTTARERPPAAPPAERAASASGAERVYAVRELPDDVRRALPAITVNGSTYSADSASRMLMIGGQIFHEGDSVAPGVALERIKPHAAVFAFRGYRYELTF